MRVHCTHYPVGRRRCVKDVAAVPAPPSCNRITTGRPGDIPGSSRTLWYSADDLPRREGPVSGRRGRTVQQRTAPGREPDVTITVADVTDPGARFTVFVGIIWFIAWCVTALAVFR